MVDIIRKYGWTRFAIVTGDDDYGVTGMQVRIMAQDIARTANHCPLYRV